MRPRDPSGEAARRFESDRGPAVRSDFITFQRVATQRIQSREAVRCGLYSSSYAVYGAVNRREEAWAGIETPKRDAHFVDISNRNRKVCAPEADNSPGREVNDDAHRDWLRLGIGLYLVGHCTLARQREGCGSDILRPRVHTHLPEYQSKQAQHDRDCDRDGSMNPISHNTVLLDFMINHRLLADFNHTHRVRWAGDDTNLRRVFSRRELDRRVCSE